MSAESSLMFALGELRRIARQRLEDVEAARRAAEHARLHELALAERQARERAEAPAEAERQAQEEEWLAAKRRTELEVARLETVERLERARAISVISLGRAQAEAELLRQARARRRPAWLLALTSALAVAAVAIVVVARDQHRFSEHWRQVARARSGAGAIDQRLAAERAMHEATRAMQQLEAATAPAQLRAERQRPSRARAAARRVSPPAAAAPAAPAPPPKIELSRECMDGALGGC